MSSAQKSVMPDTQGTVHPGSVCGQNVASAAAQPSAVLEKYSMMCSFIREASVRGIVAGIQATLLQDLASELCRTQGAEVAAPAVAAPAVVQLSSEAQQTVQPNRSAGDPLLVGITATIPEAQAAPTPLVSAPPVPPVVDVSAATHATSSEAAAAWSFPQQPQLQIKPLNLHLGVVGTAAHVGVDHGSSPGHLQDRSVVAAGTATLHGQATSDPGFNVSVMRAAAESLAPSQAAVGQYNAEVFPGMAGTAAVQQQGHQQHQGAASCADSLELFPGNADVAIAAAAAPLGPPVASSAAVQDPASAAVAAGAVASQSQAVRSGSRKHRFSKEQQQAILESVERNYALYPSRYTELVIKQMQERFPGIEINNACVRKIKFRASEASKQNGDAVRTDSLAAADAAQGLVGLAAAAAASSELPAAGAAAVCGLHNAALTSARSLGTAVSGSIAVTGTSVDTDTLDLEEGENSRELSAAPGSNGKQPHAAAVQVVLSHHEQQQQQQEQRVEQPAAHATAQGMKAVDDGAVDTAAVEAAEGLHMLMQSSESVLDAAAAAATPVAAGSLKRKLEALPPAAVDAVAGGPSQAQLAEALAAAAGLTANAAGKDVSPAAQQAAATAAGSNIAAQQQQQQPFAWSVASSPAAQLAQLQQLVQLQQQQQQLQPPLHQGTLAALQQYHSGPASSAIAASSVATPAASSAGRGSGGPASKRQRLNGVQMAELVASVRHHVQVNPERYTHCVIRDMKEKYPDLELNMGQIRKIKFRTLGNVNPRQGIKPPQQQQQPQLYPAAATACCSTAPQVGTAAAAHNCTAASAGAVDLSSYGLGAINVAAANAAKLLAAAAAATQQQAATGTCAAAAAGTEAAGLPEPSAAGGER